MSDVDRVCRDEPTDHGPADMHVAGEDLIATLHSYLRAATRARARLLSADRSPQGLGCQTRRVPHA